MRKDASISIIRILSMLFIVAYHCVCYYGIWDEYFPDAPHYQSIENWRFVSVLALEMFTIISGYLYARGKIRSVAEILRQKALRLLVPYVLWAGIVALLFPVVCSWYGFISGMLHLWFLLMLYGCFFVIAILRYKEWAFPYMISGIFAFAFLQWVDLKTGVFKSNILAVSQVLRFLPYFMAGIVIYRINLLGWLRERSISITGVVFFLSSLILWGYGIRGGFPMSPLYIWLFVSALFCSIYSFITRIFSCPPSPPPLNSFLFMV